MRFIADLHIHSPFSRATSKESNLAGLFAWAQVKGINVVGTGDFTHPGWLKQLKEQLVPAEPGLFKLKNEKIPSALPNVSPENIPTRFVLTSEISSIYKRHGKVRKVHNILYVPDFQSVERISARLAAIGNIESDGRPILGLDSRNLLEILLEQAPDGFLVPAHIWTPWFSLFGSKSGFDNIEDCFADLTEHVFALETGLSSDPDMNRLISGLDRFALISNSDCHSPAKLGREANLFDTDLSFFAIREALKQPLSGTFSGTVEFFPEEGKYHCDGHRKCQVCLEPQETRKINAICPVCHRPLTVGVLYRVMELADREQPFYPAGSPKVHSLIPLSEVLGEVIGAGPATKGVMTQYAKVIARFGSEFNLYLHTPVEEINRFSPVLGEAVSRMRAGKVIRKPGFDGEFGVIRVFEEGELDSLAGQASMFSSGKKKKQSAPKPKTPSLFSKTMMPAAAATASGRQCNLDQEKAINSEASRILVAAGPGTGKTFTLVERLAHLLQQGNAPAEAFTAITFTNRAADEVRERLTQKAGSLADRVFVGTFHRFCLDWLRMEKPDLAVAGDETRALVLANLFQALSAKEVNQLRQEIADYCNTMVTGINAAASMPEAVKQYFDKLARQQAIDLDMVVPFFVLRLGEDAAFRKKVCESVQYLFVDEFQDLNLAQYELVKILAEKAQVFAIGDPNQAIYGFRGSDLNFFFDFDAQDGTETLALNRNYRSAPEIIEAASTLIKHNPQQEWADLAPQSMQTGFLEFYQAPTPQAEAEFIVKRIEEVMGGISHFSINTGRGGKQSGSTERSFSDIAVLYRLSQQQEPLREAFERRGIPFQLVGATPFFMKPAIRPAYYWTRIACGDASVAEHLALLKNIEGIGSTTIERLEKRVPLRCPDFFAEVKRLGIPARAQEKITAVLQGLDRFKASAANGLTAALVDSFVLLRIEPEETGAKRFLELAGAFGGDLAAFAHHLEQNAAATVYDERAEAVALMTMHAAKGLEFPVVFMAGLEEGIMPCSFGGRVCDIEEERRLFYVALTRAQEELHLTTAASRTVFGKTQRQVVSRFVGEVPGELLQRVEEQGKRKKKPVKQMSLF